MSLFGGGTQTTNQSQSTNYAPWIGQMQQGLAGLGFGLNKDYLKASPYGVAGFTPDQLKGMDQMRGTALQYGDGSNNVPGINALLGAGRADAAQLGGNDFQQFMNPYLETVGKNAISSMRNEYDNSQAGLGARYAARGGLGGSGEGLARAQVARGFNEAVPQVMGNIMAQGYDRANQLASQNVDRRQQTNLANAGNALSAYGLHGNLLDADFSRQMGASQGLLGVGQLGQNQMQTQLDFPFTALQRMQSLVPNVYDSTTSASSTSPDNSPGLFQQLLGFGAATHDSWMPQLFGNA